MNNIATADKAIVSASGVPIKPKAEVKTKKEDTTKSNKGGSAMMMKKGPEPKPKAKMRTDAEIKKAYPTSNLQVLASEANKEIALVNPYIDKVYVYKNRWNKLLPLLINLRNNNYDFAIELEAKIVTRLILMLKIIKPKVVLAVSKAEGRYGIGPQDVFPYDYYTNINLRHQRDTCLDILRILGINVKNKGYDIFYLEQHRKKALSFLSTFDSKKIIVSDSQDFLSSVVF